ncbi:MAG: phosphatidate cytidylyltransferase [Candidatus Neomarinimicrobiota bacterium]
MITASEYIRKLIHLFNLVIPLFYVFIITDKDTLLIFLAIFTGLFIFIDITRMRLKIVEKLFARLFNAMLRSHELDGKFTGATWVMMGAWLTILIFPKNVAVLSLLFVSFGDIAAALIGMQFGKHKIWGKSWEGFSGGLAVCLFVAWLFPLVPLKIGFAGALTAMIVEIAPIPLDDNFKMPLAAGGIMMMMTSFL